jgi:hypothetical protein
MFVLDFLSTKVHMHAMVFESAVPVLDLLRVYEGVKLLKSPLYSCIWVIVASDL